MGFPDEQQKLRKLREKQLVDRLRINQQKAKNKIIDQTVNRYKPSSAVMKKITDKSLDWQDMVTSFDSDKSIVSPNLPYLSGAIVPDYRTQYIQWKIELGEIDERWLDSILVVPLIRFKDSPGDFVFSDDVTKFNYVFEVRDLNPPSDIRKFVTIKAGLHAFRQGNIPTEVASNPPPLQAKLIVQLINPRHYI